MLRHWSLGRMLTTPCATFSLSLELVLRKTNDIQKCRIDRVMGGVHASAVFVGTFYARSRQLKRPLDCSRDASIVQFVCERLHVNIRASLDCIRCRQQVNTSGFRQSIHAAIIITPEVSQSVSCIPPAPRWLITARHTSVKVNYREFGTYIGLHTCCISATQSKHKISSYKNNKRTLVLWLNEGHNAS